MTNWGKSLLVAGLGTLLLGAAGARAQDNVSAGAAPPPATIGPPPVRDFRLPGRTIVQQPPATRPPVVEVAPPSPVAGQPAPQRPRPGPTRPAAETPRPAAPSAAPQQAPPAADLPLPGAPAPVETAPAPEPAPAAPPSPADGGFPWYYIAVPAALLALLAFALFRRRRRVIAQAVEEAAIAEAPAVPAAKPEPLLRPWLELELKAERAQSTDAEAVVQFVLEIANTGKAPARNLRIDVKMFNAGQEQDKEIGAFFRTAGRESTKCSLPGIAPGTTGAIKGEVAMPREDMRAVVLDNKYLFVPVIAVNALYDWGDGRTGQTSKSYVVGRELEQPSAKMGAFRVDQGPRIWRTIGQRQHKLARRV